MSEESKTLVVSRAEQLWEPGTRRQFLKMLGIGGGVVMLPSVFAACDANSNVGPTPTPTAGYVLNLGTDIGILNYAYALEQLEAAFYTAVVASTSFSGMTTEQKEVFTDLKNHEVIHREFLRRALGTSAIGDLALSTTAVASITANTTVILRNAQMFEDLGVAAYNGAGKYISSDTYLTLAGKIVSVEARHAAAIRDMRDALGANTSTAFAGDDVIGTTGLDVKLEYGVVLSKVAASGLVTSNLTIGSTPARAATDDASFPTAV